MFGLGATEILIVLVIALLVLGPKRLPDAARSLGRGLGEFRRASTELRSAIMTPIEERPPAVPAQSESAEPASDALATEPLAAKKPAPGASGSVPPDVD